MENSIRHNSFFLLGIKGVAMTNIALILKKMGKEINGFDSEEQFITESVLKKNEIVLLTNIQKVFKSPLSDVYIYSAAHDGKDNPIIKNALLKGKIVLSQAEFIEKIRKLFPVSIAVSGCHGKTTTTSLLAYSLVKLKTNPSFIIGTPSFQGMDGGNYYKNSHYFVFEADEYGIQPPKDKRSKLLLYNPKFIICTNIDFDHPDVYKDIEDVKKTFLTFFSDHNLFLCSDDPHIRSLQPKLKREQYKTFGFSDDSDLKLSSVISSESGTTFSASYHRKNMGEFSVFLFGKKNISNTGAVILALLEFGFSPDKIKEAIRSFGLVKRRFEFVYKRNTVRLFDDYAHHPAEIEAAIQAIRERFNTNRIIILFQPHTFSRTESFKTEIIKALSKADIAYVSPIFSSAREKIKNFTISSKILRNEVESMSLKNVTICDSNGEIIDKLSHELRSKDIIVTMGAGDIYKLKDDIIELINTVESRR